jgi:non-specific serine/threonine protein kinase
MSQSLIASILFDGTIALEWEESNLPENHERQRFEKVLLETFKARSNKIPAKWLLVLGLSDLQMELSPSLSFWREFARLWLHQIRTLPDIEEKRDLAENSLSSEDGEAFLLRLPAMVGIDSVTVQFLNATWTSITDTFVAEIRTLKGPVEEYFFSIAPKPITVDRIHFHLVENRKDEHLPFAFLATYSTRVDEQGRTRHLPLKFALEEYSDNKNKLLGLLATVNKISKKNTLVASLVESGELFHPVGLSPRDAVTFLNGVSDFESAGILCRIPKWWKGGAQKVSLTLSVGNNQPSRIGYDALLDFNAGLYLDGEQISETEARRIIEQSEGLAFVKGKWIAVDSETLKKTLEALKQARRLADSQKITFADAMRLLMGAKPTEGLSITGAEVTCGQWLKSVLEKMSTPSLIREVAPSPGLKADLRHYQQLGLNWLYFLHSLGFGVCLADDMGLGKTVQVLALLQKVKGPRTCSLIVVPASLLENWRREIEKFTPDLKALIIHPQTLEKSSFNDIKDKINGYDIAITTYGMLGRIAWIADHEWFYVICDEAQAIKNPATKQTKSVKTLKCKHRLVMTGTPVENRLSDLWSLFDFINPGLLGSFGEFKKFAGSLNDHPEGYGRLRRVVHPYILRRNKSDKSIISDLPDKVEMKTYCTLSKSQAVIYKDLVNRLEHDLAHVDGINRKGIVLSYLMKCKQLCNHPDHYSGTGNYEQDQSGKFMRLAEICETIHEKREKALIFTQFAEIIGPLDSFLKSIFGASGLTLSGSSSIKKRKEAIDCFRNNSVYTPFFILSLKAGGVGLNLTEASHVVHFDRWWNPAVENQATDRAYRIGQKKNVVVHKFICKGTVEEKIDALIEDKKKLAGEIVPSAAENWITELDNRQIKDMFRLTINEEAINNDL